MAQRPDDVLTWLRGRPPLAEVRAAYPREWEALRREIARDLAEGPQQAPRTLQAELEAAVRERPAGPADRRRPRGEQERALVRRYLAAEAMRQASLARATGVPAGTVRLDRWSGHLAQRLLFARGLERKPVSMLGFRLLWPLIRQRRRIMPLVRPHGIYCFYSGALLDALVELIGERACLEIAAGDGTLARFLAERGVRITATDDHSWHEAIDYPDTVLRESAARALRERRPRAVLCSWPPPGNSFERQVFAARGVELYVVVTTARSAEAGDWAAYHEATHRERDAFDLTPERSLGQLILPPELDGTVLIFRRRADPEASEPRASSSRPPR